MPKFSSPLRFSRCYNIDPAKLVELGAFDPVLATDTHLFIDPISLLNSEVPEIRNKSFERLQDFFRATYKLLRQSTDSQDVWARTAFDRWPRQELKGTCLGYGGGSIRGTAASKEKIESTLARATAIIRGGVEDPDLFLLVGLFQPGIGADTISDLVTSLIIEDLAAFTLRICQTLNVPVQPYQFGANAYLLPKNPTQGNATPVVLVPSDILRELPIALSYAEIWDVARQNQALREATNQHISATWKKTSKEKKEDILQKLLDSSENVHGLIDSLRGALVPTYDLARDPRGMLLWADLAYSLSLDYPYEIAAPQGRNLESLNAVVVNIIRQFTFLMEKRDLWKIMQLVPTRQLEKVAQTLFFATAFAYCKSNNLDITPEADTGNGPVDFKFSAGLTCRILVELKLSKNDVAKGYTRQLKTYMEAEDAMLAHYLVIDIGSLGHKWTQLQELHKKHHAGDPSYCIWLIDGKKRESASRRLPQNE